MKTLLGWSPYGGWLVSWHFPDGREVKQEPVIRVEARRTLKARHETIGPIVARLELDDGRRYMVGFSCSMGG